MKKPFLLLFALLVSTASFSQQTYSELWSKVENFERDGLPKSALEIVGEISDRAKKDKNSPQFVKALLFKSRYLLVFEEEAQLNIVGDFKKQISQSEFPTKNLLENVLANLYWQYYQENRYQFYRRTETKEKADSTDFRTWDLKTIFKEIHQHFQHSLENAELSQKTNLGQFEAILLEVEGSKKFRPTLYDFLAHNALDFYKSTEARITSPAYKFLVDDPKYLSKASVFSELEITSKDTLSMELQTLKIYQKLIRFHLKENNSTALANVDIARLKFVNQYATFPNTEEKLVEALKSEMGKHKNQPESALYAYEIASVYVNWGNEYQPETREKHRWKKKEALELCEKNISQFPQSTGAQKCRILRQTILEKSLSMLIEENLPIQKPARILVSYTNLYSLDFKVYKLSWEQVENFRKLDKKEERNSFVEKLNPFKTWISKLKNEEDYQNHSTEILFPKLDNGHYLVWGNSGEIEAYQIVQVTNFALVKIDKQKESTYQLIDRNNGKPIVGAKAKVSYRTDYEGNTRVKNLISDEFGNFSISKSKSRYRRDINFHVSHNGEKAHFGEFYSYGYYHYDENETNYKTFLFTDRSIYQPGQTVYFKGIVFKRREGKSEVMQDQSLSVTLRDVNGQEIKKQVFHTNEFGSFHGEFILPKATLNGRFRIIASSNFIDLRETTYISVEEYKRPTFKTEFLPVDKTYRVNDSVSVKGEAIAFAGSKITNAEVTYHIHREANFPYWPWWQGYPDYGSGRQEIAHGKLKTDENGNFEISFKAIADESISKESQPVFRYEITADVTDINGETRSATTVVKVGYHTLNAIVNVKPKLDKSEKDHEITIETTNLNGEPVPAEGKLKVYKIKAPDYVLRPRPWPAPDYQAFGKEEFKKLFLHDSYKNKEDTEKGEKGELVFKENFDTEKSKEIVLGKIKNWESGRYLVEMTTQDRYGQEITATAQIFLHSSKDKKVADNQLFTIKTDKTGYKPGEEVKITLGTAAEDLVVTLLVEKDHKIIETRLVRLEDEKESISIPITSEDFGGFVVHYSYAAFNHFQSGELEISVPYPSTKLQIETLVFRDKLQPGKEETWSFRIKGPESEKVSAELLASMYDASLDQFRPHQWSFDPIVQLKYYSSINVNDAYSFQTERFRVRFPKREYLNFPKNEYDQLNWFGLSFENPAWSRWEYLEEKYGETPYLTASYKSSIEKGTIEGIVKDARSGLPLAGVNVVVKGTKNGVQTDFDGKFSIEIGEKDAVLIFTYLGYERKEITIGENNYFEILLSEDEAELEGVVVTAYGVAREESESPQGRVSGLNVQEGDTMILRGYNAISESGKALVIINGEIASMEQFDALDLKNIISSAILKSDEAVALYGSKGINGAIIITTKPDFSKVQIRKNLDETAFFFPELRTDEEGKISFSFTSPEALTAWKLQLLVHTKKGMSAVKTLQTVTQKKLILTPNVPRFLRVDDQIVISTKISNLTENELSGKAVLKLYDALDNTEITENLLSKTPKPKDFSVAANGNTQVSWTLQIPENFSMVKYKVIAKAGNFSDGMQNALPVLSNRTLVTETMPMWVRSGQTKTFVLEKLKNNTSKTLKHHRLTLEITSNPAWYAVQALPYLMEYPYECNEQTFARLYANALASHVANSNPRIKEVFQQWANLPDSDALLSNLEKNQELKSLLIQETPWLRDAQSENEQKKRIALLFDLNKMSGELRMAKRKLQQNQLSDGSWAWFPGGRSNRFITQHVVAGFGHLKKLGVAISDDKTQNMLQNAMGYLEKEFIEGYENIKKYNEDADFGENHLNHIQLHFLYLKSFFPDVETSEEAHSISKYYLGQIKKYWLTAPLYDKGLMALVLYRNGDIFTANKILESLKETSVYSEEMGMYWKSNKPSWFWHQAPIETQALMIEAFSEITDETKTIDNLKIWLLKNKQTNRWETTKATTDAVYALLMQGSDWLSLSESTVVKIGGKSLPQEVLNTAEAGTGFIKTSWKPTEITPEMATVQFTKKGKGVAWGGLYWQYFEDLDKITHAETPLKLKKGLFLVKNTDTGEKLFPIDKATALKVGDLIRVRIELKVDRVMEFVHMKDMRASGLEPINVISRYKWQDGLGYYESTKDASTNFFFDYLPKGVFVFEYDLRVNNAGDFSNGITTIQCMYAPEFTSHSEGVRINVGSN